MGEKLFDGIDARSVHFSLDAVNWIISSGIEIIISDIYESRDLEGVFLKLFENNISTVCYPVNLHKLHCEKCKITILPLKMQGVTQLPCRIIAEF